MALTVSELVGPRFQWNISHTNYPETKAKMAIVHTVNGYFIIILIIMTILLLLLLIIIVIIVIIVHSSNLVLACKYPSIQLLVGVLYIEHKYKWILHGHV